MWVLDDRQRSKLYAVCEGCISDLIWLKKEWSGMPRKLPKNNETGIRCLYRGKCTGQMLRLKEQDRDNLQDEEPPICTNEIENKD